MIDVQRIQSRVLTKREDGAWLWKTGPASPIRLLTEEQAAEVIDTNAWFQANVMPRRKRWLIPMLLLSPIGFVATALPEPDSRAFYVFGIAFVCLAVAIIVYGLSVELPIVRSVRSRRLVQLIKSAPKEGRTGVFEWFEIIGAAMRPALAVTLAILVLLPGTPRS